MSKALFLSVGSDRKFKDGLNGIRKMCEYNNFACILSMLQWFYVSHMSPLYGSISYQLYSGIYAVISWSSECKNLFFTSLIITINYHGHPSFVG